MLTQLPGFLVTSEHAELRSSITRLGARIRHEAELMSLDLERWLGPDSTVPAGVEIRPVGQRVPPGTGHLESLAFPPGHPDIGDDDPPEDAAANEAALRPILVGDERWAPLTAGRLAVRPSTNDPVGIAVLSELLDGPPPHGGPWLAQLFRHPDDTLRGLGAALLDSALEAAREDGLRTVGLSVTVGNHARGLYASRGFVPFAPWTTYLVPPP